MTQWRVFAYATSNDETESVETIKNTFQDSSRFADLSVKVLYVEQVAKPQSTSEFE